MKVFPFPLFIRMQEDVERIRYHSLSLFLQLPRCCSVHCIKYLRSRTQAIVQSQAVVGTDMDLLAFKILLVSILIPVSSPVIKI